MPIYVLCAEGGRVYISLNKPFPNSAWRYWAVLSDSDLGLYTTVISWEPAVECPLSLTNTSLIPIKLCLKYCNSFLTGFIQSQIQDWLAAMFQHSLWPSIARFKATFHIVSLVWQSKLCAQCISVVSWNIWQWDSSPFIPESLQKSLFGQCILQHPESLKTINLQN